MLHDKKKSRLLAKKNCCFELHGSESIFKKNVSSNNTHNALCLQGATKQSNAQKSLCLFHEVPLKFFAKETSHSSLKLLGQQARCVFLVSKTAFHKILNEIILERV